MSACSCACVLSESRHFSWAKSLLAGASRILWFRHYYSLPYYLDNSKCRPVIFPNETWLTKIKIDSSNTFFTKKAVVSLKPFVCDIDLKAKIDWQIVNIQTKKIVFVEALKVLTKKRVFLFRVENLTSKTRPHYLDPIMRSWDRDTKK